MHTPSYKALLKQFNALPKPLTDYFQHLPKLVEAGHYEIAIAYAFLRIEQAHNQLLYCGVVKLHRANAEVARSMQESYHLTREGFHALFVNIFSASIPSGTLNKIKNAEKIRDKVIHGKNVPDAEMREALSDVLDYSNELNEFLNGSAEFRPFGNLQGFKGRGKSLDKETTKWLLKGIGYNKTVSA